MQNPYFSGPKRATMVICDRFMEWELLAGNGQMDQMFTSRI
jgi:hypothetical protein